MSDFVEPKEPIGTVTELFAGVGGFRIGLARAGWKTEFSNQWEPSTKTQHASDVYVHKFGAEGHSNEDIAKVLDLQESGDVQIPQTTMLVGGFPCQDYSVAKSLGSSTGLAGKKGVLWWEILRLVRANRPEIIFLENVDRLLKSPAKQRGRDFAVMLASLSDEGYFVEWRVINAAEYGFAQRRRRVFIIAKRSDVFAAPKNAQQWLEESGVFARGFPISNTGIAATSFRLDGDLAEITETFDVGGKISPFRNAGLMVDRRISTLDVKPQAEKAIPIKDVMLPSSAVPESFFISPDALPQWQYLKGAKKEERTHQSGAKYFYSEGSMTFPDPVDGPARTILTGEGGSSASRFKHVVVTPEGRLRRLTPVELERLNGFPDEWTKEGNHGPISDIKRAFFMGNALVVGVIERIGKVLAEDWQATKSTN